MVCWKPTITPDDVIMHSAKGSTWKEHKYISKKNGVYKYAVDAYKNHKEIKSDRQEYEEHSKKKYESSKARSLQKEAERIMKTGMIDGIATTMPEKYANEKYREADIEEEKYSKSNTKKAFDWVSKGDKKDFNKEVTKLATSTNPVTYLAGKAIETMTEKKKKPKAGKLKRTKKNRPSSHNGRGGSF